MVCMSCLAEFLIVEKTQTDGMGSGKELKDFEFRI